MTESKHFLGYFIFTNEKLGEKIYIANSVEFEGSFVTFKPSYSIEKSKKSELEGTSVTLPEHVIKEIIFQEIDEQTLKGRTPQS
ncbi:MAG TPA: hypothetical protein VF350_03620 [Candidatus Bathyarchaeia archaeon]|jgi:hypothetical protein